MRFWFSVIDLVFDLFDENPDHDAARWFRNLESKDGQEPRNGTVDAKLPIATERPGASQGVLPIKVIK